VASGRSVGIGEGGVRCGDEEGGGAGRGSRTARWRGSRGSRGRRCAWLPRVRLLLSGGSGFAAGGAAPGASVLLLLFPFCFSSGLRVGGQGTGSPEAARLGRAMGGGSGFL
jgi:hypothetical protein